MLHPLYEILSLGLSAGLLGTGIKVLIQIGEWKEWVRKTDKEVTSHGEMLQQITATLNRVVGLLETRRRVGSD